VSGGDVVLVAVAGLACGAINAVAGGGTLVLFPALVATGMGTLAANVTNSVSAWPGYLGAVVGFRGELEHHRDRIPTLSAATAAGAAVGCGLLLATPSSTFDVIVPALVAAAALLLAAQPAIARRSAAAGHRGLHHRLTIQRVGAALAGVYGGYFGGVLGVVFLAILGATSELPLRTLNGLKSVLQLTVASVTVVLFGLFGPVHWWAVAVASPSALVGGLVGARLARRIEDRHLRAGVVVFALGVAIYLAVR
jgi:uncharacterized membrane protein YfcA